MQTVKNQYEDIFDNEELIDNMFNTDIESIDKEVKTELDNKIDERDFDNFVVFLYAIKVADIVNIQKDLYKLTSKFAYYIDNIPQINPNEWTYNSDSKNSKIVANFYNYPFSYFCSISLNV